MGGPRSVVAPPQEFGFHVGDGAAPTECAPPVHAARGFERCSLSRIAVFLRQFSLTPTDNFALQKDAFRGMPLIEGGGYMKRGVAGKNVAETKAV